MASGAHETDPPLPQSMEIHQLRYFVAVATEGSFSKAAARVRVAQPSLSQQIHKLEQTVGRRLFDRLTRRVILTEAGHELLPFAQRILNEIRSAQRVVEDQGATPTGTVRIGVLPTIAPFIARDLIQRVRGQLPKVEMSLVEDVTTQLVQLVDSGEIDLAIISTCRASPGIHVERWADEELVVALPETHPLAGRKALTWRDLRHENVLLADESNCLTGQIQKWCAKNGTRYRRAGVIQLGTLLAIVAAGAGISLVPRMAVAHAAEKVAFRSLSDVVPEREINLLRNTSRYQAKAALAVAEIARVVLQEALTAHA